jgi:hypothetical protein
MPWSMLKSSFSSIFSKGLARFPTERAFSSGWRNPKTRLFSERYLSEMLCFEVIRESFE